ncbi:MAG TPA: hypothetical protein VIL86_01145 [Tepidisphaeraceae bacterium]
MLSNSLVEFSRRLCHRIFVISMIGVMVSCDRGQGKNGLGGSSLGSQAIPNSELQLHYVVQFDAVHQASSSAKGDVLFIVVWVGGKGAIVHSDKFNRVTMINGHTIRPSYTERSIYSLQQDYTLQDLGISDDDRMHLFSLLQASSNPRPNLMSDAVWQRVITPHLAEVQP